MAGSNVVNDGTSDGIHDYYVDHYFGGVWATDFHWQNPSPMFCPLDIINDPQMPCWGLSGITYDWNNNSLWVSAKGNSWIGDYTLSGDLLSLVG